jgi:hypothetical protein
MFASALLGRDVGRRKYRAFNGTQTTDQSATIFELISLV